MNQMIKPNRIKLIFACFLAGLCLTPAVGSGQDAVYRLKDSGGSSKVSGKITAVTPDGATIGGKLIPASEIKRIAYSKEPGGLNRARDQMDDGRYSDSIEELEKLDPADLSNEMQAEVAFIRSYSMSQISLRGGNITPAVAGKEIRDFINAHTDSVNLFPAIEQYGKQLFAFGRPDLAAVEFEKLSRCSWPEYKLKGQFQLGKSLFESGNLDQAKTTFEAILAYESNDDLAQTYKLLAKCEIAKLLGLQGNVEESTRILAELVNTESADNSLLFANLYNALGAVFEKAGNIKEARMAYLKTNLLYASEQEAHAESLYHLALLYPQLQDTDKANDARDTLKTRYRNSYWAAKL